MNSKQNLLLEALQKNLGSWVCGYCNSKSNQPAGIFRDIKKQGYLFEEHKPNRWGKDIFCTTCNSHRTHYKMLFSEPQFNEKKRITITAFQRKRVLDVLNHKDAFTGATISSTPEIDHKEPWSRLKEDIDISTLSEKEIKDHFQLLTREHNLLKDRACGQCRKTNKRPPFLGIEFWYEGSSEYINTCVGCGWFDGAEWRECVNKRMQENKQ